VIRGEGVAVKLWSMAVGGLLLGLTLAGLKGAEPLEKARHSPAQRLTRVRLASAQASVERLAGLRRTLPEVPGLKDFRCSFHAHAEDASHTGGTRPEMLKGALAAGVDAVFLSDHFRPPRDYMDSWRFLTNGVLFVPGSECRGFLAYPEASVMEHMQASIPDLVTRIGAGAGMVFLSHIEERSDHSMEGLTGLEIYNRHYDAKRDITGMLALVSRLTDPKELAELQALVREYPDGVLGSQIGYQEVYLEKWDRETVTRRLTGVGANDCHHNQVFVLHKVDEATARLGTVVDPVESMRVVPVALRPGVARILAGKQPGEQVQLLDVDPYDRAFRCVSTHVLASRLEEGVLREAVKAGRVHVAHTWMGDATGFRLGWLDAGEPELSTKVRAWMGDERRFESGGRIDVESPLPGRIRLLRGGEEVARAEGNRLSVPVTAPGVYRAEVWLELGGEWRPWIYSNPLYLRGG
jgi:hypothetical protein